MAKKKKPGRPKKAKAELLSGRYQLVFHPADKPLWEAAAERERMPLSVWIRVTLNKAAQVSPAE